VDWAWETRLFAGEVGREVAAECRGRAGAGGVMKEATGMEPQLAAGGEGLPTMCMRW
jgi:hypothetical protein